MAVPDFDAVAAVEQVTGIAREHILCVYLTGSWMYGTREPGSDVDFIAVVDGYRGPLAGKADLAWTESHLNNVAEGEAFGHQLDVPVFERRYWQFLLDEHVIWALLCHHLRDHFPHFVLLERERFTVDLRLRKLLASMQRNMGHNINQSRKLFTKDVRRSKKRVVITLTFVQLALQLATHRTVTDLQGSAPLYFELREGFATWAEVQAWFRPRLDALADELTATCREYARLAPPEMPLLEFLEGLHRAGRFTAAQLWWLASVRLVQVDPDALAQHPTGAQRPTELVQLLAHPTETPAGVLSLQQAAGTCIKLDTDGHPQAVLAACHRRFFAFDAEYVDKVADWATATVTRRLDGLTFALFWHAGEWRALPCPTAEEAFPVSPQAGAAPFLDPPPQYGAWARRFWAAWQALGLWPPGAEHEAHCFVLELVGAGLGTLAQVDGPDAVFLHGVIRAGAELPSSDVAAIAEALEWPCCGAVTVAPSINKHPPRTVPLVNELQALLLTTDADPFVCAGFVVAADGGAHRVAVPSPARQALKQWVRHPRVCTSDERRRVLLLLARATDHVPYERLAAGLAALPGDIGPVVVAEFADVHSRLLAFCAELEAEVQATLAEVGGDARRLQAAVGKHPFRDVFWRFLNQGVPPFRYLCMGEQLLNVKQNQFVEERLLGPPTHVPNNW